MRIMVKVNPSVDVDQFELNRKLRHACPRIKRWNSRIVDAEGDVNRIREQAINRSPVYVAVQRGSRNIQIRTRTKPKWWRKWIQEGKKYGFDESFSTPIHIPSHAYRYQKQVSFSKPKPSPPTSPRRSLPVSPVKTGIHSPIKVSYLKNEQFVRSPKKEYHQRNVPLLTLTPVPLNQVLKKKARIIGHLSSTFGKGKGRWVEQDASLLTVPGEQVYQYDTASETETEDEREKRGGEILHKLMAPTSPTDAMKRLASAKRRETPPSPKSPKRSPKKEVAGTELTVSEEDSESDSKLSPNARKLRRKARAVGQTSLLFSPRGGHREHADIQEESEEDQMEQKARDKSATLRKMRAAGTVRAALSPSKSPKTSPKTSPKIPKDIKKKIKAIGKTSASLSPRGKQQMVDEFGNAVESEDMVSQEKSPSSIGSIFRKIKTIARLSSTSKAPDASPSGIGSLMTKMRFLMKLSPARKKTSTTDEEEEEEEDEEGNVRKVRKKKPKSVKSEKAETEGEDEEEEAAAKESIFRRVCGICYPCICRRKEPELMEYESGSQINY